MGARYTVRFGFGITAKQQNKTAMFAVVFQCQSMEYSAKIYSRVGELMQGVLPDASAFLVSGLPSQRWFSEAVLRSGAGAGVLPPKAREALGVLERQVGLRLPAGVGIELRSNIPWGKGLSSSSTDVLSVLSVVDA